MSDGFMSFTGLELELVRLHVAISTKLERNCGLNELKFQL